MSEFLKLASGLDVSSLALEIHRQPELWDQNPTRRTFENTPHADMTDIWIRFRAEEELRSLEDHKTEHRCVFWPAWYALPSLRPLVFGMMTKVQATELGSVLVTRLPQGGTIKTHTDAGAWAPEFFNMKLHLILSGQAIVTCLEESQVFGKGDLFTFDNLKLHSVENHWPEDRIALIVSMRVEA